MGQRKAKTLDDLVGRNEYERKRIAHAKKIRSWTQKSLEKFRDLGFKELDIDSLSATDKADYRAAKEKEGLDDRRAAMEALKKLHKDLGMKSPEAMKAEQEQARQNGQEEAEKGIQPIA